MTAKIASFNAERAIRSLGQNIKLARRKRRFGVRDFAERMGVSESTVIRMEQGNTGVSLGTLAMACLVLGDLDRIADFMDPGSDDTGLSLDYGSLPKRINRRRPALTIPADGTPGSRSHNTDVDGVGF